jgi:Helix-turn-helix domain
LPKVFSETPHKRLVRPLEVVRVAASAVPARFPMRKPARSPSSSRPWRACPEGKSYRRLNAIHLLLIGVGYDHVLRNYGRGERCLRLWISRFNEQGIDGLTYRPRGGRPRKLSAATVESEILAGGGPLEGAAPPQLEALADWQRGRKDPHPSRNRRLAKKLNATPSATATPDPDARSLSTRSSPGRLA